MKTTTRREVCFALPALATAGTAFAQSSTAQSSTGAQVLSIPQALALNPMHTIQHSEFILVWEGQVEFQREDAEGKLVSDTVGPGGVLYVAMGTKHTLKNVGSGEARYFVVAIGGDAK